MTTKKTQIDRVWEVLNSGGSLTTKQASRRGINLHKAIYALRNEGAPISTEAMKKSGPGRKPLRYSL